MVWEVTINLTIIQCYRSCANFNSSSCSPSCHFILMGKRELVVLLSLSSWCLVIVSVLWLFLTVPCVGLQCVIVVFHDHTHLDFWIQIRIDFHASRL